MVPLHLTAAIAVLGQEIFAAREAARGRPVGTLALSLGALVATIGLVVFLGGIPASSLLAQGRATVHDFLLIGFATLPIVLVGTMLMGVCTGLERWRLVIAARLVPAGLIVAALVVLFVTDTLTVGSAATVYIVAAVITVLVVAPVLRGQRFRFDLGVVKAAIPFGAKACAGTTADLANARLDQLLMITLVAPRELGLYAVAANIGTFGTIISGGISPPLLARISAGEVELAPRALRTMLFVLAVSTAMFAAATPIVLDVLFGPEFVDATGPAWLLLAAGVPLAGAAVLTATLQGVGRPGLPSVGQTVALGITVPGLLLLLPSMGIMGAAIVSLVAYTANFLVLLVATIRVCELSASELLVPKTADLTWFRELVRSRLRAARARD